jgi:DNA replication protein DnaC
VTDTPQLLLAHHLKALKLPTFLREYDKLARQCAAEGLDHIRFLLRLAELELIDRERRMVERRIKEARFPSVKSLDSFDFAAIPSLNKTLVLELARSEYVTRRENHRGRQLRHRQDAHRSRARSRGLSEGVVSWLLYRCGSRP